MADAKGFKIGVAHEFQIVKNLPHEPHDIPLIRIVTDGLSDTASTTCRPAATFR
jgi:5-formyltetrahydrofolate cyclo-ligase